jgi:hypothetical protein
LNSPNFKTNATAWLATDPFGWDTSYLKITDNLMVDLMEKISPLGGGSLLLGACGITVDDFASVVVLHRGKGSLPSPL